MPCSLGKVWELHKPRKKKCRISAPHTPLRLKTEIKHAKKKYSHDAAHDPAPAAEVDRAAPRSLVQRRVALPLRRVEVEPALPQLVGEE